MCKQNYLLKLLAMIIKNQERFKRNLSLEDKWWIIKNEKCAIELFVVSITERDFLKSIAGVKYFNFPSEEVELKWEKTANGEKHKGKNSELKLPEVMSLFVLHQKTLNTLSVEQIKNAIKKYASMLDFYMEIISNRDIITIKEVIEQFQYWKKPSYNISTGNNTGAKHTVRILYH